MAWGCQSMLGKAGLCSLRKSRAVSTDTSLLLSENALSLALYDFFQMLSLLLLFLSNTVAPPFLWCWPKLLNGHSLRLKQPDTFLCWLAAFLCQAFEWCTAEGAELWLYMQMWSWCFESISLWTQQKNWVSLCSPAHWFHWGLGQALILYLLLSLHAHYQAGWPVRCASILYTLSVFIVWFLAFLLS